jgi:hypothetical protein
MQTKILKLSDKFTNILVSLPETGMGYQIVKIFLKSGKVLYHYKVVNSEFLMLEDDDILNLKDIDKIELDN